MCPNLPPSPSSLQLLAPSRSLLLRTVPTLHLRTHSLNPTSVRSLYNVLYRKCHALYPPISLYDLLPPYYRKHNYTSVESLLRLTLSVGPEREMRTTSRDRRMLLSYSAANAARTASRRRAL